MYRFGAQQFPQTLDPTDQTEDLGNDHVKANSLCIKNLKIIMSNLEQWCSKPGASYKDIKMYYNGILSQYQRMLGHGRCSLAIAISQCVLVKCTLCHNDPLYPRFPDIY